MLNIWVRAKRDARKMPMVLRKYYREEEISLKTVKARSLSELSEIPFDFSLFNIVVLGRDDKTLFKELKQFRSPLFGLAAVNSPQVRTEKVSSIFKAIEYAKSEMRNGLELNKNFYRFSGINFLNAPLTFDTDCYILYPQHARNLEEKLSLKFKLPDFSPVFRDGNREYVFLEGNVFLEVEKPDSGEVKLISAPEKSDFGDFDFSLVSRENKDIVEKLKKEAKNFLMPYRDKKAVIPLSGGKDSQAVLDIAVEVWDREKLLCIHADTGFDFEENRNHAEYLCEKYGVGLKVIELNLHKKGEPDFSRWCTFEKTEKLYEEAEKFGAEVFLMGDRDAESFKRRRKPRKRMLKGIIHLFPVKFWSTAHIQVLIENSQVDINPLYLKGFWRTGCKSCPFLTSWERNLF